ncbi:hypothetical protein CCP2SC5_1830003 [Azospirillaceae bacterium]
MQVEGMAELASVGKRDLIAIPTKAV